jgi:cell division protein FtsL
MLTRDNAAKNKDLIEDYGYTVTSIKTYMDQNNILIIGIDAKSKTQLTLKCWETAFSKDIVELSALREEAITDVAKKLVTLNGSTWRTIKINGMQMIEVRYADKDETGSFYSVQYITIRNEKIYSLGLNFSGEKSEEKTQAAWETAKGLSIKDFKSPSPWSASAIFEFSVIWVIIIAAAAAVVLIIISLVKDRIKYKADMEKGNYTISRRKK